MVITGHSKAIAIRSLQISYKLHTHKIRNVTSWMFRITPIQETGIELTGDKKVICREKLNQRNSNNAKSTCNQHSRTILSTHHLTLIYSRVANLLFQSSLKCLSIVNCIKQSRYTRSLPTAAFDGGDRCCCRTVVCGSSSVKALAFS